MHRDSLYSHFLTRPDNAAGNFAAVGYQYLSKLASSESHDQIKSAKKVNVQHPSLPPRWTMDVSTRGLLTSDSEERLPIFNRLAVLNVNLDDFTFHLRLNLIHQFHCLDDADDGFRFDLAPNFYKRLSSRRRGTIKGSDNW